MSCHTRCMTANSTTICIQSDNDTALPYPSCILGRMQNRFSCSLEHTSGKWHWRFSYWTANSRSSTWNSKDSSGHFRYTHTDSDLFVCLSSGRYSDSPPNNTFFRCSTWGGSCRCNYRFGDSWWHTNYRWLSGILEIIMSWVEVVHLIFVPEL